MVVATTEPENERKRARGDAVSPKRSGKVVGVVMEFQNRFQQNPDARPN